MEAKKDIDWPARQAELRAILEANRSSTGEIDCIVPVSGGKDGSSVAYKLKHEYGMNAMAITVTPPLSLALGNQNLRNFIDKGYNHIQLNPDVEAIRVLNRLGFVEKGLPYFGWLVAIEAAVVRMAVNLNIALIFHREDGEVEYGGSTETEGSDFHDAEYMKRVYFEDGYDDILRLSGLNPSQLYFFTFPTAAELQAKTVSATWWSHFESWDPYQNYLVAKERCGLQEADGNNVGTFTNFAQNDQAHYALHTYLMYLKFGFGRANQDAGIEIRRGAMTRDQSVNLVNLYDGQYPEDFVSTYLEYYQITIEVFDSVLDRWANKSLFDKADGRWQPTFTVK